MTHPPASVHQSPGLANAAKGLHGGANFALGGGYALVGDGAKDLELDIANIILFRRKEVDVAIFRTEQFERRFRRWPTLKVHVVIHRPVLREVETIGSQTTKHIAIGIIGPICPERPPTTQNCS
jgi:hypothetical protein